MQKVEKLQQRLHLLGGASQSQHTIFVDDEAALRGFSAAEHFDTPAELLDRSFNRPRVEQLMEESQPTAPLDPATEARLNR